MKQRFSDCLTVLALVLALIATGCNEEDNRTSQTWNIQGTAPKARAQNISIPVLPPLPQPSEILEIPESPPRRNFDSGTTDNWVRK
jgi:hypothetical protein